jgi:hypothetical protein
MSRIKARIPAIINSCRIKLMRSSLSSDDGTTSTPSALSCANSINSESRRLKAQANHRRSLTPSRSSETSIGLLSIPESQESAPQWKTSKHHGTCTRDTRTEAQQDVSSPGRSADSASYSLNKDPFGIPDEMYGFSGCFPSDDLTSAATCAAGIAPHDSLKELENGRIADSSHSQLSWSPLKVGWEDGSEMQGQHEGELLGKTVLRGHDAPLEWDFLTKDVDSFLSSGR